MACGDFGKMEFLVHSSLHDQAPQRVQLRVRNPLSAEDMLQQIRNQFVQLKQQSAGAGPSALLGSHLFFFSSEEGCYVPLDGQSASVLHNYGRLLVHAPVTPSSEEPDRPTSSQHTPRLAQRGPSNVGSGSTAAVEKREVCGNKCAISHDSNNQRNENSQPSKLPPLETDIAGNEGREGEIEMKPTMIKAGPMLTMELMLKVTGVILSEYAARLNESVIEPTEESLWGLIEEVLYGDGNTIPYSLDPHTVDAFTRTIVRSLSNKGKSDEESV
ncbi:uncharacterized protein TEOVI_000834700 [Trypanosoma equiperdum]|uniref:Uncharacterized protein n=2 Tax=Trypanozoon TaxID=39700 RepID=Q57WG9_TRYB2|nr:hypothetical protein, conserved [Trypanosoma brucei brucei TREU927]AAX70052.1 hypothetical protein, conserved [Trypanosoma brucei]AAZ12418.1 hypothetical protein, conserved [Trypanosoma brucei brucei TREU927]SCU68546.1 hypothetical protein, conserved [Trypanosoma equiperdum]